MQRKVIQVGTSAAVLIPKAVMDERNIKIGDTVNLDFLPDGSPSLNKDIDPEIFAWTEKLRERYRPLLKKLASS